MENTLRTIRQIITVTPLAIITAYITGFMVNFDATASFTASLFSYHNYIMPKAIASYTIVSTIIHKRKKIKRGIVNSMQDLTYFFYPQDEATTLEGIPHDELLDHLFVEKTFRGKDIEKKWGIPRYIVTILGDNLERVNILTRGRNNARILNEEFSRADVQDVIKSHSDSNKLLPLFRRKTNGSYSPDPTAKEISARVADMASVSHGSNAEPVRNEDETEEEQLPLSPNFTRRTLAQCA